MSPHRSKISDWLEYESALSTAWSCDTCSGSLCFVLVLYVLKLSVHILTLLHYATYSCFFYLVLLVLAASHFPDNSLSSISANIYFSFNKDFYIISLITVTLRTTPAQGKPAVPWHDIICIHK